MSLYGMLSFLFLAVRPFRQLLASMQPEVSFGGDPQEAAMDDCYANEYALLGFLSLNLCSNFLHHLSVSEWCVFGCHGNLLDLELTWFGLINVGKN